MSNNGKNGKGMSPVKGYNYSLYWKNFSKAFGKKKTKKK